MFMFSKKIEMIVVNIVRIQNSNLTDTVNIHDTEHLQRMIYYCYLQIQELGE